MKPIQKLKELNKLKEIFSSAIFYLAILIFIIGFNFTDSPPPSGWYQQFMPDLGGRSITDVFFLDSLTGWGVTNATNQAIDTTYLLKTTNSGDNWVIQYRKIQTGGGFPGLYRVYFLSQNTGFICGVTGIDKSTNGGFNWVSLNAPLNSYLDMSVLNEDIIWIASSNSFTGGIFRTTNGGVNWTQQLPGSANPDKIYMYNGRIGFASCNNSIWLYRTTNSGINWDIVSGVDGFNDIYFVDTLTGWKAYGYMKKTTNGGLNWITQTLPSGGIIQTSGMLSFSNVNRDTIWGDGGYLLFPNNQVRDYLNRTTNGGINWLFQIPDTSIFMSYYYVNFVNRLNGWATSNSPTEIHTVSGGDTVFYTPVKQISSITPDKFYLKQNYPNPFNPITYINYELRVTSYVKLAVFDITGKEILTLVNNKQNQGVYKITFDGTSYSSGVYFYSLFVDGVIVDTKKMVLLK